MAEKFQSLGKRRTLVGTFVRDFDYYSLVDTDQICWEVNPDRAHRKLLGKRVRATGWETGPKQMIIVEMIVVE